MNRQFPLATAFALASACFAVAQQPPSNATLNSTGEPSQWRAYSQVAVYIDGNAFPSNSSMANAVQQGFVNAQTAYSPNDGVTFTFATVYSQPTLVENSVYVTTKSLQVPSGPSTDGQFEETRWQTTFDFLSGTYDTTSGTIYVNSALVNSGYFQSTAGVTYAIAHGDSHLDGLGDDPSAPAGTSIMSYNNNFPNPSIAAPQQGDIESQYQVSTSSSSFDGNFGTGDGSAPGNGDNSQDPYCYINPGACDNSPTICSGNGQSGSCGNCIPPTCSGQSHWDPTHCSCIADTSPIIIDTDGTGFHLTSSSDGVIFDFFGDGKPIRLAWTAAGTTNGWLALDRNGNGVIDSGKELFGNITGQPESGDPNGFLALSIFDLPENGGNHDDLIDSRDAIWPKLLVWIDSNHDGISQPEELHHLDEFGIQSIGLTYRESRRIDAFGNEFRYRGILDPERGSEVDRVIYDVILSTSNRHRSMGDSCVPTQDFTTSGTGRQNQCTMPGAKRLRNSGIW